jgi:hypothetical protein
MMNNMVLQWLKQNVDADAFKIVEIKPRITGLKRTEFNLGIDYKNSPSLIISKLVYGDDLVSLWKFLMGDDND